jgi:ATP phosphoribosyltransferase regulatory subunit
VLAEHSAAIGRTFDLAGYDLIDVPPFELLEVIERGLGEAAKRAVFRAVDPATGEVVALRPDFTAQVARIVVARMSERPRPLRLRYQGRVLRALDPHGRGLRARDVYQAGIELYGIGESWSDVEVLAAGARAVPRLDVLDLGHAAIVDALLPRAVDVGEVFAALGSKDSARLLKIAPSLMPLLDLFGPLEATIARARAVLAEAPGRVLAALEELMVIGRAVAAQLPSLAVSIDLSEQRGLGYYTGVFFHGYASGAPDAVLLGGRYDGLLARYGRAEPAVGLAIDVDALAKTAGNEAKRSGVVFAEPNPNAPLMAKELELCRARGERAVIVPCERAHAFASANGYRALVEMGKDGAKIERTLGDDAHE